MTEYFFRTEQLAVGYREPLIGEIEIRLKKGEILTLLGPNGAGKSTVLKSIARQLAPLGGTVWLGEDCVERMSGAALSRRMAVVMTERLRAELMTCADVVATGRYPYTGRFGILSEADRRAVREAMELVQVAELWGTDFAKVSDGQRQRVMLARAVCQEPELLILDEPTSYLDVRYKLEFLSLLQKMRREKGLTVILSLHELELAERISDRICCLNGRYVDRIGTPEEIFVPGYLKTLFGITSGSYDEENGSMELAAPRGEPEVFVIAGGGSGRAAYRRLQREGTAFATGILFDNDLDIPAARALAARVIEAEAFGPVGRRQLADARECLDACKRVLCCRRTFGVYEEANRELLAYAKERGKEMEIL